MAMCGMIFPATMKIDNKLAIRFNMRRIVSSGVMSAPVVLGFGIGGVLYVFFSEHPGLPSSVTATCPPVRPIRVALRGFGWDLISGNVSIDA